MLGSDFEAAGPISKSTETRRSRRVWSAEEKRRIVDEAVIPGASVAEIARRHGVNANLVFTWRKAAQANASTASAPSASALCAQSHPLPRATSPCEFIPIGVYDRPDDGSSAHASGPAAPPPRPRTDERPGAIEIDLADGARLRVDAFVDESALRRVLSALRAHS